MVAASVVEPLALVGLVCLEREGEAHLSPHELFTATAIRGNYDYATVEFDPNGHQASDAGSKMDAGKVPMWRGLFDYFPRALSAVAEVSAAGHAKGYPWGGWRSVPEARERYTDAMLRHLAAEARGEEVDDAAGGTDCYHDAMVAWNALARLEKRLDQGAA